MFISSNRKQCLVYFNFHIEHYALCIFSKKFFTQTQDYDIYHFAIYSCDSFSFKTVYYSILIKQHLLFIYVILRKHYGVFNHNAFLVEAPPPSTGCNVSLHVVCVLHAAHMPVCQAFSKCVPRNWDAWRQWRLSTALILTLLQLH